MDTERWADLSDKELKDRGKLTPEEQAAVDNFMRAAKALPKTLCIEVEEYGDSTLTVSKRMTLNSSMIVAKLRKKSLVF